MRNKKEEYQSLNDIKKLQDQIAILKKENELLENDSQNLFMLQQVLSMVPDHVYWKDKNSVYLGCNEQFSKTVGLSSPKEIVGKTEYSINPINPDAIIKNDRAVILNNTPKVMEEMGNDKTHYYLSTKAPIHDKNGKVCGILGVSKNITSQRIITKIVSDQFTLRENDVFNQIVLGLTSKQIAKRLGLSFRTVEDHIANIKNKLKCNAKSEIIEAAIRKSFIKR